MEQLLVILAVIPVLGGLAALALSGARRPIAQVVASCGAAFTVVTAAYMLTALGDGQSVTHTIGWIRSDRLEMALAADRHTVMLVLAFALVMLAFSLRPYESHFGSDRPANGLTAVAALGFAFLNLALLAGNPFMAVVALQCAGFALFLGAGFWGGPNREIVAMTLLVIPLLGAGLIAVSSFLLLRAAPDAAGIFWQWDFDLTAPLALFGKAAPVGDSAFLFMAAGAALLSAPIVFHVWVLPALNETPPLMGALILIGLSKTGMAVFLRFCESVFHDQLWTWAYPIAIVAIISIAWGVTTAIAQRSLDGLLAAFALAHTGYTLLAVSPATARGLQLAWSHNLTSAAALAAAVFICGELEARAGHSVIDNFGGLGATMPRWSGFFAAALLFTGFAPLGATFFTTYAIVAEAFGTFKTFAVLAVLAIAGGLAAAGWTINRLVLGPRLEQYSRLRDLTAYETAAMVTLLLFAFLVGTVMPLLGG